MRIVVLADHAYIRLTWFIGWTVQAGERTPRSTLASIAYWPRCHQDAISKPMLSTTIWRFLPIDVLGVVQALRCYAAGGGVDRLDCSTTRRESGAMIRSFSARADLAAKLGSWMVSRVPLCRHWLERTDQTVLLGGKSLGEVTPLVEPVRRM